MIETIYAEACKILENKDDIDQHKVLLTAPTGVAAFNINWLTLHRAFHLPTKLTTPYQGLGEDILNEMRCEIGNLQLLIIDEISMVGQLMLHYISHRLCQLKQKKTEILFGGISILTFGDFYQLPPVNSTALYRHSKYVTDIWKDNFKIITLTEVMRQKDKEDSEMLCRLRIKKKDEQLQYLDFLRLQSRVKIGNIPQNVLHVFAIRKEVERHNNEMIAEICKETVQLHAIDIVHAKKKIFRKKEFCERFLQ